MDDDSKVDFNTEDMFFRRRNRVKFMDYYSCNLTGHADSLRLYEDFGMDGRIEDVNQEKLIIKHHCELETIGEGT